MDRKPSEVERLPGFRFHPTEEELIDIFLRGALMGRKPCHNIISTINLYHFDPWELPGLANIGEKEWYFFVPRERKYASGGRANRTTKNGFWKATGTDRPVRSCKQPRRAIGLKKILVFYKGRSQRASKTDWIMNEYRFPGDSSLPEEDMVLCKVYRKATPMRVLEQRAVEEEKPVLTQEQGVMPSPSPCQKDALMERSTESEDESGVSLEKGEGWLKRDVMELQMPMHASFDNWIQDPCLLLSPWFKSWTNFADMMYY